MRIIRANSQIDAHDHSLLAFVITGGCGSIGGTTAKQIIAKGGIALVSSFSGSNHYSKLIFC